MTTISVDQLNNALEQPILSVMNFLNEVVVRYPKAISFSAGRPYGEFCKIGDTVSKVYDFIENRKRKGETEDSITITLGQYGKTLGIINDSLAAYLKKDENIEADPEDIVVTTGCQEAMALCLGGLFRKDRDVLLATDPTYIGITGLAEIMGIEVEPVAGTDHGIDLDDLKRALRDVAARGKTARAFYVIPDFNNPLGSSMNTADRKTLLDISRENELLILEDNPYGLFRYEGPPVPTIKSMDAENRVIYLGTFSKTLYPGLRGGFLLAGQKVKGRDGRITRLSDELSKVKSLITVNTSPIIQAITEGVLLDTDYSLIEYNKEKVAFYKRNRDLMFECLEQAFPGDRVSGHGVTWNRPEGGFFMTVNLPFAFTNSHLERCAREAGVIVCPMSFFALKPGREHQIRLSFSYVTPDQIRTGIAKLAGFIREAAPKRNEPIFN